jgi:hypothetical protein
MVTSFSHPADAVAYYKGALRKEKEALDVEIKRRLKRITELEELVSYNEKQLKIFNESY